MTLKKIPKLILVILAIVILAGWSDEKNNTTTANTNNNQTEISGSETEGMEKLTCSREADAGEGVDVNLDYEIYYQGEYIQILHSTEQIVTEDQATLDEYENAYKKIYKNYEGLKYYDNNIDRTDNSVTNDTVINYGKIDTNKLLEIEGEEDNVIKDGKVKLSDWLDFAEQFGTKCE